MDFVQRLIVWDENLKQMPCLIPRKGQRAVDVGFCCQDIYLQPYSCRILLSHCEIFTWEECMRSMNWIERMLLNHFCLSFYFFHLLLLHRLEVIERNWQVITISLGFCRNWKKKLGKEETRWTLIRQLHTWWMVVNFDFVAKKADIRRNFLEGKNREAGKKLVISILVRQTDQENVMIITLVPLI